ncbi:sigma-54-dependent Fis family transcriptional regulator [Bdellovibrio svalbardensis]|uniref:Sigma-54-dependent Fis family transcriptional regulator n=1 Tax=Bdellovibrio svalbardensis TaxID=2972972 RepID=A0ABT6DLL1_9BACT|nr:sigma-54-dependent Fis family transcriptional regulator [Bdellovibrio svalbardensis]MDG0817693.1 sigma-54-dependent Fis family transcriptional regulator [Bdellovibrio svalbardensis]
MSKAHELLKFIGSSAQVFFDKNEGEGIVARILDLCIQSTGADRGTLFFDPQFKFEQHLKYLNSYIATGVRNHTIVINTEQGIAGKVFRDQKSHFTNNVNQDPDFFEGVDSKTGYKTEKLLAVPLHWKDGKVIGVIEVLNKLEGDFDENDQYALEALSMLATIAFDNYELHQKSEESESAIEHRKNIWRKSIASVSLRSKSAELQKIYDHIGDFGRSDSNILITGESGSGKEVIARLAHHHSGRREGPFIAINCAAIPESLFEAELFGVVKGAATGTMPRQGQIELAHRGTLFLDEIGEMPIEMQAKLLRVLQERKVQRLGSNEPPRAVDFRLICATNKNIERQIQEEKFREDLYYRINVVNLVVPSLRDRKGDIPELAGVIIEQLHQKRGWKRRSISDEAMLRLVEYNWPGNIRELENKIEAACLSARDRATLLPEDFQFRTTPSLVVVPSMASEDLFKRFENMNLKEAREVFEAEMIQRVIQSALGNKSEAARRLGLSREGLRKILTKKVA